MQQLKTDYLVVGAGAMGMAFTDVLMTESDVKIIIVDKHHQPGGHWNDAYPFVRLHQPSAFYGVKSKQLGENTIDTTGLNKGLYELATNEEVCSYFDQVMQRQFLPSGRVQYFPSCEYQGNGEFSSLLSKEKYKVSFEKEVDSTYMNVVVPSKRPPPFTLSANVHCAPLNELPALSQKYEHFNVVGAGKTSIDAVLFLLRNEVDPDRISWVMPRDSWILDRAQIQPTLKSIGTALANQVVPGSESKNIDEFFSKVSDAGGLLRIDENVKPTMYRCSTVTKAELIQLKRINKIIRMGRVTCQQVFSAAFIGHVEVSYQDDEKKNDICKPVPHPNTDVDFLRNNVADSINQANWDNDPNLQQWLQNCRLDFSSHILNSSRLIRFMSLLSKIPFLRKPNRALETQAKATRNIQRLLKELDA